MSAFKKLKDVSNNFEHQLRNLSTELYSAKIDVSFEDGVAKKLEVLTFLTSKLRLLKAKPLSDIPQITEEPKSEETIKEYGELAQWKVLEQQIVKSLRQTHAVNALIKTPDSSLDPEMVDRKEKIVQSLKEYRQQDSQLRILEPVEAEKEQELAALRMQWDNELTQLREISEAGNQFNDYDMSGPLYTKLRGVVDRLELMRWLIGLLVTSRGSHDWLANPEGTARLLRLASKHNSVESFLEN